MKKPLKILLAVLILLVLLVVGAVAVLTLVIDPNDYKPELAALVEKKTGHKVEFNGPLELKVFPRLAVDIKKVTVLSDQAFGVPALLELDGASLDMALLPLLSKRLEVRSVLLSGAKLSLVTDKRGRNNWDMPVKQAAPAQQGSAASGRSGEADKAGAAGGDDSRQVSGEIDSIKVENCLLNYKDLRNGQDVSLRLNTLELEDLALGKDMGVLVDAVMNDKASASTFAARLDGKLRFDPEKNHVTLDFPKLGFILKSQLISEPQTVEGSLKADASLASLTGNLSLTLKNRNLNLSAQARSEGFKQGQAGGLPSMNGDVSLQSNPAGLLAMLGADLGLTDPKAMNELNLELPFTIGAARPNELAIVSIRGNLDSTSIQGALTASLPGSAGLPAGIDYKAALRLELGDIDLNRYLPKGQAGEGASRPQASPAGPGAQTGQTEQNGAAVPKQGPLKGGALEKALLDAEITLKSAAVKQAVISKLSLSASANRGVIEVRNLMAQAFEGSLTASARADLTRAKPPVSVLVAARGFDIGEASMKLLDSDKLSGKAALDADLRFSGLAWLYADGSGISRTLSGNGKLTVSGGKIRNFQLIPADAPAQLLQYRQDDYPFNTLGGSFKADNGVIRNEDLAIRSPRLNADGQGAVNLWSDHIDYRLVVSIPSSDPAKPDKLTLPLRATGYLDDVKYGPDLEAIGKGAAKEAAKDVVEKLREEGKLPPKDSEEAKQLEERVRGVKDLLQGLKKK